MGQRAISLCMMVKNEEARLGKCLDSVQDLVGEIVIVDTGSSDATCEIAASFGARVLSYDFSRVDFAAARNHGIAAATGQWIMVLDADERLHSHSAPIIRELVGQKENAGYYFERVNLRDSPEKSTVDYAVRLFPNRPSYRYRGRVHETVDAPILAGGGRLVRTGVRIDHDFACDQEARRRRNLWYIEILNEEIAADPADTSRLDFLAAEFHQLGMFDEAAAIAERIARVRPLEPEAHLNAGIYNLLHKADRDRARAYFKEALQLRPGYAEAESFLALAQAQR